MNSPDTRRGRRVAHAPSRLRLPALSALTALSRPTVVKGLVGIGLATSVAAAVAIPVQAGPDTRGLSGQTAAMVARDRADAAAGTTSRSSARTAVGASATAVTAPAAAESVKVSAGPVGVTAVAKPKPKPTPVKTPTTTSKSKSTSTSTSTSTKSGDSASSTSVPSGTGSGAYVGWCSAKGLGGNASIVCSAVRSNFGITNIGGFRAGAGDHGTGKAVDVMVAGSTGDAVAQWAINHMSQLNITYVIWKQRIWLAGASSWRSMEDRGSVTANHYDHVHISVE